MREELKRDCSMPKRTPDQLRYSSETNKIIGQKLRDYYQACTNEELPPRLLASREKIGSGNPGRLVDRHGTRVAPITASALQFIFELLHSALSPLPTRLFEA